MSVDPVCPPPTMAGVGESPTRSFESDSNMMTSQEVSKAPMDGRANQWLAPQVVDL